MSSDQQVELAPGAIVLSDIGKAYRLYPKKWGRFAEWLGAKSQHHLHWVLRGINLQVAPGEAVGIIGENGAGKSTLLKLITGVSRPTQGGLVMGGQVSALLELGIGFNDMFTGRQNAIDMLRLTGVPDTEVPRLVEEIAAFADLGEYFEFPVRTYSSGMQCRLAFATATATRPDILIVDEALSVGDVFFQQRCFDRIQEFRKSGTTLLFVSHSVAAVYALCDRAVLLRNGAVVADDVPKSVIDIYNAQVVAKTSGQGLTVASEVNQSQVAQSSETPPQVDGFGAGAEKKTLTAGSYRDGSVELEAVSIEQSGRVVSAVLADEPMSVLARFCFQTDVRDPHIGLQVRDSRGEVVYRSHTHGLGLILGNAVTGSTLTIRFDFDAKVLPGEYTLTLGVGAGGKLAGTLERSLLRHNDVVSFSVMRAADADHWDGRINLQPTVAFEWLEAEVLEARQ